MKFDYKSLEEFTEFLDVIGIQPENNRIEVGETLFKDFAQLNSNVSVHMIGGKISCSGYNVIFKSDMHPDHMRLTADRYPLSGQSSPFFKHYVLGMIMNYKN